MTDTVRNDRSNRKIILGNLSAEEQRDLWKITERFIVKTAPKLTLS